MHNIPEVKRYNRQRGMTLVELLVALALGVVLVGGITRVYLENKKNYVQDEEMARLQENGRFAINFLKRELKMSGFTAGYSVGTAPGQLDPGGLITTDCSPNWALDPTFGVDFVNDVNVGGTTTVAGTAGGLSLANCVTEADVENGTDIITVKRVAGMPTIQNAVYASDGIATGEEKKSSYYIKADENGAEFLYVPASGFTPDILVAANNISMWLYMAKVFYIRNYSVVAGDGIPTLMMVTLQDKEMVETPLIEGVEDFHVEFGIPATCDPESDICDRTPVRFAADIEPLDPLDPTTGQISSVTVARIHLLMRTRNEIRDYTDTKTYALGSKPAYTKGGKFMRRVFTTTIKLRN